MTQTMFYILTYIFFFSIKFDTSVYMKIKTIKRKLMRIILLLKSNDRKNVLM